MPRTRASTRMLASKRKLSGNTTHRPRRSATSDDDPMESTQNVQEEIGAETKTSIMDNLRKARSGVEKLYARIQLLEQENGSLRSNLQRAEQSADRSAGARRKDSRRNIQTLERTIMDLNAARERDRRTIAKLQDREVARDARELADGHDDYGSTSMQQTADLGESAIKLLRTVCNTIDMNTLAEGEECAICMENMEVRKCYSLPCQHPLCDGCFQRMGEGANAPRSSMVQCPHCRKIHKRDECETITHTAVQQWDLLLDVSRQWAAIDVGEIGVGEEDKDSFLDDDSAAATESSALPDTLDIVDLDAEMSVASAATDDNPPVAYRSLSSPLKRKRLTELAAQRSLKSRS